MKNAVLSLLGTSVPSATCLMMITSASRSSIVMDVESVELEDEITSTIATLAKCA